MLSFSQGKIEMSEASHTDLDLTNADDRTIYRLRVSREFSLMKGIFVKEEASRLTGRPVSSFTSRLAAERAIADLRIESAVIDETSEVHRAALDCFGRP